MAERIVIRLAMDVAEPLQYQWSLSSDTSSLSQHGDLEALASAALGRDAILLLPATMVWLTELELPVKNPSQIKQALPFALEDQLADDVDQYHLSWLRLVNRKLAVAAVAKSAFADLLQPLRQAGIELVAAYPETLLVPYREGECSVAVIGDRAVLRHGRGLGGGIDSAALPLLLETLRRDGADWSALRVFGQSALAEWAARQGLSYSEQADGQPWTVVQSDGMALNLLTGPYAVRTGESRSIRRWLPAASLLALALAVQLAGQIHLNQQSRQQIAELDLQTQALFRKAFPEIKRVVNVRVQAEQALREMRQRRSDSGQFLRLLYAVGERLAERPDLALNELSFAGDSLQLRLPAADSSALDTLLSGLRDEWTVDMQTTNDPGRGEEVRIDVRPR